MRRQVLFASLFIIAVWAFSYGFAQNRDIQAGEVVRLGNPFAADGKKGRALNVWDLQTFDGKIYIGGGDVTNNAGPINVWAYNPSSNNFNIEDRLPEEEISRFKVVDDELYIPASDPRNGDANKFYRKQIGGKWTKYASDSVKLAHVRDLIEIDSNTILMVGNNRDLSDKNAATAITFDNGLSFQRAGANNFPDTGNAFFIDYNWYFSIFSYQDKIYAPNGMLRDTGNYPGCITVYNPEIKELVIDLSLGNDEFIPASHIDNKQGKYGFDNIYYIWNPVEFKNYLIYPVKSFSNIPSDNSIQKLYQNSLGFYLKEAMGKSPTEVELPNDAMGEDVLTIDDKLYVLANKKNRRKEYTVYVFKTREPKDPSLWSEVLKFNNTNKARSFEYLDSKFYFGLGQDYGEKIGNSGDILSYSLN